MFRMVLMLSILFGRVIQIWLYDVLDVMESIGHGPLECSTSILEAKWKLAISEGAPWVEKSSFFMVFWSDFNLIING